MTDTTVDGGPCGVPLPAPTGDPALELLAQALGRRTPPDPDPDLDPDSDPDPGLRADVAPGTGSPAEPVRRCDLFASGHAVHWIQANRGRDRPSIAVAITDVAGITARVMVGGREETWRFHDTTLLQDLLAEHLFVTGELHGLGLLRVHGRLLFPNRDPATWQDCPLSLRTAKADSQGGARGPAASASHAAAPQESPAHTGHLRSTVAGPGHAPIRSTVSTSWGTS